MFPSSVSWYTDTKGRILVLLYLPIMKALHYIAFTLLIVGGLNWLLVGLFQWDIGTLFGGQYELASRAIYILVGLSTIVILATHRKDCKVCSGEMPMATPKQPM